MFESKTKKNIEPLKKHYSEPVKSNETNVKNLASMFERKATINKANQDKQKFLSTAT